jgi:hypothetical protein
MLSTLLTTFTVITASPVSVPATAAGTVSGSRVDVALEWYDATAETVTEAGAPTYTTNSRTWAVTWLAAARALRAAPAAVPAAGPGAGPDRRTFEDAALAAAVHASLVALIPARTEALDALLRRTLARIPDGPAERRGVAAGIGQARAVLTARAGDGLDPASVSTPFPTPPPAPGVWRPTPPRYLPASQAGSRHARPFLLRRADEVRLARPPAVGSARHRKDLAEVRSYGSSGSPVRTPRQTETATFWLGGALTLYTRPLRVALARSRRPAADRAKLVALFHVALVDAQIANFAAKYAFLRWRPVTAIRSAGTDGDPATIPDPGWTPLHETPASPDYPSGHSTYSGAAERVLTALAGPRTAPFAMGSASAPGVVRTYTTWRAMTLEMIDARVWSGIHTRAADLAGVRLGRGVADLALRRADRLFRQGSSGKGGPSVMSGLQASSGAGVGGTAVPAKDAAFGQQQQAVQRVPQ